MLVKGGAEKARAKNVNLIAGNAAVKKIIVLF